MLCHHYEIFIVKILSLTNYAFLFTGVKSRKACSSASLNIDEITRKVSLDPLSKQISKTSASLGALPTDTNCNAFSQEVFETLGLPQKREITSHPGFVDKVKKIDGLNSGSSAANLEDIEVIINHQTNELEKNKNVSET